MALYTRKLKLHERKILESHLDLPEEDLPTHRLQIIVLSAAGKRVPEISEEVHLHPINVRKWIHRFNRYGLDGLRSGKSPGRPPVFTDEQRNEIVTIANTNPRLLNLHYSRWSLQRLRRYLLDHDIVEHISVETIRQIIQSQESTVTHRYEHALD
ncbi:MAG: helix-turn-helix domain containing protein [Caldilineaceae bacterium]|nr:helix-turn-helix domain containing protein [Caldilineaceae bacterium]